MTNNFIRITPADRRYPRRLVAQGFTSPLWVAGDWRLLDASTVAVIGSRRTDATPTLQNFIDQRAGDLARVAVAHGMVDVSGLALGCDIAGERAFVRAGGRVVSVLAAGLDQPVYPAAHRDFLAASVRAGGCVVSQFQPGTKPSRYQFVVRDTLQALLADRVVALMFGNDPQRGGRPSGTWHAVHAALDAGKPIGVLDPQALTRCGAPAMLVAGNRQLIARGQALVDRIPW